MCDRCKKFCLLFINEVGFMLGRGHSGSQFIGCQDCEPTPCTQGRLATDDEISKFMTVSKQYGIPFVPGEYYIVSFD